MRIHINTLILLEEEFGTFEIGTTNRDTAYELGTHPYNWEKLELGSRQKERMLYIKFGYWRQVDRDMLESRLRSLAADYTIQVVENLVDEDDECGELYNYIIYTI